MLMQLQTNESQKDYKVNGRRRGTSICLGAFHVPGFVLDAFSSRLAFQFLRIHYKVQE